MDERIRQTRNRIASRGFGICYWLLLAALLYRQFYLRQSPAEYWDMALIFLVSSLYVAVAGYAKGAVPSNMRASYWIWTVPVIAITIVVLSWVQGRITNLAGLLATLAAAVIGASAMGLIFNFLYRRWEGKAGLEE
jgi:hypothetical protein